MQELDKGLFGAFAILTLFGLIMMSSISVAGSFDVTGRNDYYFWRHFIYILIGIPVFFVALKVPSDNIRRMALPIFFSSILLLLLVLTIGKNFGTAAQSWLKVGPFSFQPTEFVKISTAIFLAAIFSSGRNDAQSFEKGFIPFAIVSGIPVLLIAGQPDFGSIFVLCLIVASIYFVAGANLKHFLGGIIFTLCTFLIIVLTTPYIKKRVQVLLNPELDPLGAGFQVKQGLIAIGSGGLFGRGFHNSIQKFDYLPEVQSDTIFSAISEEMGFFRILILIGIYIFVGYRGLIIARNAKSEFAQLLAIGLTVFIVGQAFVNIGVNLAILPNTGITLPLISYGGSSLLASFTAFGLLLNISSGEKNKKRKRNIFS